MRIIELDGTHWRTPLEFLAALREAIGAPDRHGYSPDAFVDSMIYGGINSVEPPYEVVITGSDDAPQDVRDYIAHVASILDEARAWKLQHYGEDVEVALRTAVKS